MISLYFDSIPVKRSHLHKVKNVSRYVFDYMYFNYQYKDSLLKGDMASFEVSKHEYNDWYYQTLWRRLNDVTNELITDSSKATAKLIRTAWIEAGRPQVPKEINFE